MNSYIDILIQPDAEFRENLLLNKVFIKLHKALYDSKQASIGVSFPHIKVTLGDVVRLHGDKVSLEGLQQNNWLGGLSGYCEVSDILPVPEQIEGYRTVSRKQPTMTLKKLKQRIESQMSSGILKTAEDVKAYEQQYKKAMFEASLDNPYLELQSSSTGHLYRIFIELGELQEKGVKGVFNYYALSKTATIPCF